MSGLDRLYKNTLDTNMDFIDFNCSNLCQTAINVINSQIASSTPLPTSLPNKRVLSLSGYLLLPASNPLNLSLTTGWYPWLSSIPHEFTLTRCDDPGKLMFIQHEGTTQQHHQPGQLQNQINCEEFSSINIFGRDFNQMFDFLPRYDSVQEVVEDLALQIKILQADSEIIQQFHNTEDL